MNSLFDPSVFEVTSCRGSPPVTRHGFTDVRWSDALPYAPARRLKGVRRLGIEYEARVRDVLEAIYGTRYVSSPVIRYSCGRAKHAAVPDGVLRLGEEILILEVKLAHTPAVWEQLMERYLPLVRSLEPQRLARPVEICRSYDPAVRLPGSHKLISSLHRNGEAGGDSLEVLRWKI